MSSATHSSSRTPGHVGAFLLCDRVQEKQYPPEPAEYKEHVHLQFPCCMCNLCAGLPQSYSFGSMQLPRH